MAGMAEVESDQLRETVEKMHGGTATLSQSVPVRETFEGNTVWEGVVHVFRLEGRPNIALRLRLVLADRGRFEAAVLCRAASAASRWPANCGAGSDCCRTQR
jgi:hypothetical protein